MKTSVGQFFLQLNAVKRALRAGVQEIMRKTLKRKVGGKLCTRLTSYYFKKIFFQPDHQPLCPQILGSSEGKSVSVAWSHDIHTHGCESLGCGGGAWWPQGLGVCSGAFWRHFVQIRILYRIYTFLVLKSEMSKKRVYVCIKTNHTCVLGEWTHNLPMLFWWIWVERKEGITNLPRISQSGDLGGLTVKGSSRPPGCIGGVGGSRES